MSDIGRILNLIKDCYPWSWPDMFDTDERMNKRIFEENGSIYFISEASIDMLAIWEFEVTRLIYLALVYYDINKPFNILHPANLSGIINGTSIFEHNGESYRYINGYSYLTDTRSFDCDYYGNYSRICESEMDTLLEVIIDDWKPDKPKLLSKVLDKYRDYISVKSVINIVHDIDDCQCEIRSILLRFIHENDTTNTDILL
jgi:hypothetical protein